MYVIWVTPKNEDICSVSGFVISWNLDIKYTCNEGGWIGIRGKGERTKTSERYKVAHYPNEAHIRPNLLRQSLVRFLAPGTDCTYNVSSPLLRSFWRISHKLVVQWRALLISILKVPGYNLGTKGSTLTNVSELSSVPLDIQGYSKWLSGF